MEGAFLHSAGIEKRQANMLVLASSLWAERARWNLVQDVVSPPINLRQAVVDHVKEQVEEGETR